MTSAGSNPATTPEHRTAGAKRVVIVGAGPGGLMVAETAAAAGHSVSIFDQRRSPGRKFVLAGRGGLNITHSEPIDAFVDRYGPEATLLKAALDCFGPDDLRKWAADLGESTFVGSSGRVFPESFRSVPLLRAWLRRLDELGVVFHSSHEWLGWDGDRQHKAMTFRDSSGTEVSHDFDVAVLALGGSSWPKVGSDGSWVETLRAEGIEVADLSPTNCGVVVAWTAHLTDRFAGQPVKNAAVSVAGTSVRGDPIVTMAGLEGGPVYAHSRRLREQIEADGFAEVTLDLLPDLDVGDTVRRLVERRKKKRSTSTWLDRCGISPVGIGLMREATANVLPTDPDALGELIKAVPLRVESLAPIDRAISCAGGVCWSQVDDHLALNAISDTYVVGEMLDWEAPTGGYLLQAVFSTGRYVGEKISLD